MRPSRLSTNEWLILLMLCSAFFLYLGMGIGGSLLQRSMTTSPSVHGGTKGGSDRSAEPGKAASAPCLPSSTSLDMAYLHGFHDAADGLLAFMQGDSARADSFNARHDSLCPGRAH